MLRDDARMEWTAIATQLGLARSTAFYLYACRDERTGPVWGARHPVIATLALAGPRVTELCQLNVDDVDLAKARFCINDSKTPAGIRAVDIYPRLFEELTAYAAQRPPVVGDAPAFPPGPATVGTRTTSASGDPARALPSEPDSGHAGTTADPRACHPPHLPPHLHHVHDRRRLRPSLCPGTGGTR